MSCPCMIECLSIVHGVLMTIIMDTIQIVLRTRMPQFNKPKKGSKTNQSIMTTASVGKVHG